MDRAIELACIEGIRDVMRSKQEKEVKHLRREAALLKIAVDAEALKPPHFGITTYTWEKEVKHEDS